TEAAAEIAKGNEKAAEAREKAEQDARREKESAEAESSGGLLGWLASAAKAVFDGLKRAVKAVFDLARKAVKFGIERGKRAAVGITEFTRKAIVTAIKAAGALLILAGDIVLAGFPELKEKYRNAIVAGVQAAEDTVNRLADDLKAGVQKLLDMLGT